MEEGLEEGRPGRGGKLPTYDQPDLPVPSGVCGMRHRLWARSTGGEWVAVLSDCVKCVGLVPTGYPAGPTPCTLGVSGRGLERGTDTDHCLVSPSGQKMTQGPIKCLPLHTPRATNKSICAAQTA